MNDPKEKFERDSEGYIDLDNRDDVDLDDVVFEDGRPIYVMTEDDEDEDEDDLELHRRMTEKEKA